MSSAQEKRTAASVPDCDLWAITSYFNPVGYRRRWENYRVFRDRLKVPLVAVELAYGPDFELSVGDADILVQLRGGDVMWQKERLLNIALEALPAVCTKVAWLDCDIVFQNEDWPEQAAEILEKATLVQLFTELHYLPRDLPLRAARPNVAEQRRTAIGFAVANGLDVVSCLEESRIRRVYSTGMAWAAQRNLLERTGFYDAFITGGGDRTTLVGLPGIFAFLVRCNAMNLHQVEHFKAWAERFNDEAPNCLAAAPGNLFHLWHGALEDRSYLSRFDALAAHGFNPFEDISLTENGLWRWSTDKHGMHERLRGYFAARKEDG